MLQVSNFTRILVALVLLGGILVSLPNALPARWTARFPTWFPHDTVSLGLDLQGGSYLLLEVDFPAVQKDKTQAMIADIRAGFRKARIQYQDLGSHGDVVQVRVSDAAGIDAARKVIDGLNPNMTSAVMTVGAKEYDVAQDASGLITMTMTQGYITQTHDQVVDQSIEVVRRRIDQLGTKEPDIAKSGDDRILVQVPGLQDPTELKAILGKTAKMTFRLVDVTANPNAPIPAEDELLQQIPTQENPNPAPIVVQRRVMVSGDRLTDASQGFDQQTGQPIVDFRFDTVGARQFGDATKANIGHPFAIVLDNQVISAPNILSAILGGSGYITGGFTVKGANDLAILLRAGALPAPLNIIEERTVGAELGADSINAGRLSALAGLAMVAVFMILRYGLFGLFADIALTLNVILLLALLTLFGATLTLPGIAGIVLTMGMAVDANVLIYERIREEQRNGRGMLASIDTGFRRAMNTIIDANMTHLIASLILFELGSGPVAGFAVTLAIGIITSFFTAVMVTRLIVVTWLNVTKPRKLAI